MKHTAAGMQYASKILFIKAFYRPFLKEKPPYLSKNPFFERSARGNTLKSKMHTYYLLFAYVWL